MKPEIERLFSKGVNMDYSHFWMDASAKDKTTFETFWTIAKEDRLKNAWRAMWVIDHATQRNKDLIDNILDELYELILRTENNSLLRMGLKMICQRPISNKDIAGEVLNKCEELLLNTKMPVATRANSLQYLFEFCRIEPDLINELEALLDHLAEHENSSGMISRMRHIRKACANLKTSDH